MEYLNLMCALTEKSNYFTEFNIKKLIKFDELITMLQDCKHVLILQRKILQIIIDAFIDLEEIDGAERESIEGIETLVSILDVELT